MAEPRNARKAEQGGRAYVLPSTGETFPSVTTIIGDGIPKKALPGWAARTVAEWVADNLDLVNTMLKKDRNKAAAIAAMKEAPWAERDAAADIGTLIHDIAQARVLELPIPSYEDHHAGFVRSFEMFLDDWQPEYEFTEMEVYHRAPIVYAGSLDFIARLPGLGWTLGDYKTSRTGIWGETCLQLAAYRFAEFAYMPNGEEVPIPQVDTCVALNLRPEGYKLVEVQADEAAFRTFQYAMQVARFVKDGNNTIGAPLPPPKEKAPA